MFVCVNEKMEKVVVNDMTLFILYAILNDCISVTVSIITLILKSEFSIKPLHAKLSIG